MRSRKPSIARPIDTCLLGCRVEIHVVCSLKVDNVKEYRNRRLQRNQGYLIFAGRQSSDFGN